MMLVQRAVTGGINHTMNSQIIKFVGYNKLSGV